MLPTVLAVPTLHGGAADPDGFLFSAWTVDPGIAVGLFALVAAYVWATGPRERRRPAPERRAVSRRQRASFFAGVAVLFVSLGPPLSDWADHFLLLAHMTQHLLLTLVAPPLLLLGIPGWALEPLTGNRWTNAVGRWLTRPLVAYIAAAVTLIAWHVPILYEAATYSDPIHSLMHLSFVLTSVLVWWPLVGDVPQWPRIAPPLQCLYLFALVLPGSFVGAVITYADPGMYRPYDTAPRVFGLDVATDQQSAGLLMWVGGTAFYLAVITFIFLRWASEQERADRDRPATPPGVSGRRP